jgi:hypothetical protein
MRSDKVRRRAWRFRAPAPRAARGREARPRRSDPVGKCCADVSLVDGRRRGDAGVCLALQVGDDRPARRPRIGGVDHGAGAVGEHETHSPPRALATRSARRG